MDRSKLQAYFGISVAGLPSCVFLKVKPRPIVINCMDYTVSNRRTVVNDWKTSGREVS